MRTQGLKINLDYMAAKQAQILISEAGKLKTPKPAKSVDNLITKTLGVLQENGIYACVLFLKSRTKDEIELANHIVKKVVFFTLEVGEKLEFGWDQELREKLKECQTEIVFNFFSEYVLNDLAKLLLMKESLERMLTYARYGAKAKAFEEKKDKKEEQV